MVKDWRKKINHNYSQNFVIMFTANSSELVGKPVELINNFRKVTENKEIIENYIVILCTSNKDLENKNSKICYLKYHQKHKISRNKAK